MDIMYGKPSPSTPPPPPAQGMTAQQYYLSLYNQGYTTNDAYNASVHYFGTGQSAAKKQASQQQTAALGQAAGTVAGAVGTSILINEGGKFIDALTGKEVAKEVAEKAIAEGTASVATTSGGSTLAGAAGNASTQAAWNAGADAAAQAGTAGSSTATAGATEAGTATGAEAAGSLADYAVPVLGIAAGAYGGYKTAEMIGDTAAGAKRNRNAAVGGAASGAAIGTAIEPGLGTAIGAVIGGLAGLAGSVFGSHKGGAQVLRDKVRDVMQQGGILDNNYQGTLADGSKYDFGKDGKTMKWSEIDKYAAEHKATWDQAVQYTDALVAGQGVGGKKASDLSAWFAKAATSNAGEDPKTAKANVLHFAQQQGITYDSIKTNLDKQLADNWITQDAYNAKLNAASDLFKGTNTPAPKYVPQGKPSTGNGLRNNLQQNMGTQL